MIVGIDSNSFGFRFVSDTVLTGTTWYGKIDSQEEDAQKRRFDVFRRSVLFFELLPAGTRVFIEEPLVMVKNPETTRRLVMMAGVIESAAVAAKFDGFLFYVSIGTWRKAVLGKGSGRSAEMKALAFQNVAGRLKRSVLMEFEEDDNLCDAFGVMEYGRKVSA